MTKTSNASLFRRHAAVEEQMIRGAMPQTSVADPEPLTARRVVVTVANVGTSRLVRPAVVTLTASIAEMTDAK